MISPVRLIFSIWLLTLLLWFLLPFQLLNSNFSLYGLLILGLFLFSFYFGSKISKPKLFKNHNIYYDSNFSFKIISLASLIASFALFFELKNSQSLGLMETFLSRSDSAQALLYGESSNSSIYFKIAFLTYPSAYVYLAMSFLYSKKLNYSKIFFFGLLPIIFCSLSMGGRVQLLYAALVCFFSYLIRHNFYLVLNVQKTRKIKWSPKIILISIFLFLCLMTMSYYFINVFFVRADVAGGSSAMFTVAEEVWGIGFKGYFSDFLFDNLNENVIFLLFMFSWYIVQGLVMSNIIFTQYEGPVQLGVYGNELITAIARRADGNMVYNYFQHIMDIGTYGFLPSSFGSIYIDFKFFGIFFCFIWGWWSMQVYKKTLNNNVKSMLLYPFMTIGVIFSIINTPIGLSNGFVTFTWLFIAYYFIKQKIIFDEKSSI